MLYVFDSGLGGLTALRELRTLAPDADIVYFGDTGRVPYGTRSRATLMKYSMQDMRFLLSNKGSGDDTVLVACGTVSSGVIGELRGTFGLPIIGVVDGAARAAAAATKNKRVGVIGTSATINSGAFTDALHRVDSAIEVHSVACPLFISIVEYGFSGDGDPVAEAAAHRYLDGLADAEIDTLILGCTHFPIIAAAISHALPEVTLINSGAEAAREVKAAVRTVTARPAIS